MFQEPFDHAYVLTGPTGAGKSELALELAERWGAEIISMDSMTLYRGLDVGTAKPTVAQRQRVPHALIDVLDPWQAGTVAWWLDQAAIACRAIEKRGKIVLFVGGTPLYLMALIHGLFPGPPASVELRQRLEAEAMATGVHTLYARLTQADPETAHRLHPNDLRRVVRALEVWELTGRPISDWQQEWRQPPATQVSPEERTPRCVILDWPRAELYARINQRVLAMLEIGWLDECRRLRQASRPLSRQARQAVGYAELFAHLEGAMDLDTAVRQIQTRTRQFAKQQRTWFRRIPGGRFQSVELTRASWHPRM